MIPEIEKSPDPYEAAQHWAYDRYQIHEVIANRWQLAFWLQLFFSAGLVVLVLALLPLKTWEPIIIHRNNQTSEVWVESVRDHALPETTAEIESNLARYVIARETISAIDASSRTQQVYYESNDPVAKAYETAQAQINKSLHKMVKVQDIIFLDSATPSKNHKEALHRNLAKVDFVTTENNGQQIIEKSWVVTISWEYLGTPASKAAAWANWNGFTVTYYRVDQRNV